MKTVSLFVLVLLGGLFASDAYAQCADPPGSPRGRCIKDNGGRCDTERKIWVSPNDAVRRKCAPLSPDADRAAPAPAPAPRSEPAPASPAPTETAAAIFRRLKLLGRFAPDCGKPASNGNPNGVHYVSGADRDRILREPFGDTPRPKILILKAFTEENLVSFAAINEDKKAIFALWIVESGRYRPLRAKVDGNDVIKDGVLLDSRRDVAWQNYCGPK